MSEIDLLCLEKFDAKYVSVKSDKVRMRRLIMHLFVDKKKEIDAIAEFLGFKKTETIYNYIGSPNISWKPTEKQINQYKKFLGIEHV